ncbi:alpha/beta fold hydrolase, partial [Nocardioides hankookensis]
DELRSRLPGPMVPGDIVQVPVLPVSPNGKVDRQALRRLPVAARERDASATDTERRILEIWSDLLGYRDLGYDDDFFDVGGHSLLVATLAGRLEEGFGFRPGIAALMVHRTVRAQAVLVGSGEEPAASDPSVLTLVEGSGGRTLVLIHPIGGTSGLYRTLAQGFADAVPGGHRVLGLQAPGVAGERAPIDTVEELAAHHLGELDRLGIEPPFLLGGISMGGSIAYEIGRLSVARGDAAPFVALLDTPGPGQLPTLFDDDAEMLATIFGGGDAGFADELRALPPLEMFRRVLGAMAPEHAASLSARDREIFAEVWRAHSRALLGYRPAPAAVDVHYYKATETVPPHPPHPERPWEELLGDRLLLTRVEGNHESIIERPQVDALVRALGSDITTYQHANENEGDGGDDDGS